MKVSVRCPPIKCLEPAESAGGARCVARCGWHSRARVHALLTLYYSCSTSGYDDNFRRRRGDTPLFKRNISAGHPRLDATSLERKRPHSSTATCVS